MVQHGKLELISYGEWKTMKVTRTEEIINH